MKFIKILVMAAVFIGSVIFFFRIVEKEKGVTGKTLVHSETVTPNAAYSYYMKYQNDNIVIYNSDHTVYEYTDLVTEFLPEYIINELSLGIYFQNQEELYEFLETYSS